MKLFLAAFLTFLITQNVLAQVPANGSYALTSSTAGTVTTYTVNFIPNTSGSGQVGPTSFSLVLPGGTVIGSPTTLANYGGNAFSDGGFETSAVNGLLYQSYGSTNSATARTFTAGVPFPVFTFTLDGLTSPCSPSSPGVVRLWAPADGDFGPPELVLGIQYTSSWFNAPFTPSSGASQSPPPCSVLPIFLNSFSGIEKDCGALLSWSTSQEQNSKSFVLETSTDGSTYTPIATIAAAGNSNSARNYSYTVGNAPEGTNMYRLKLVDIDNSIKYSSVVAVKITCLTKGTIMVYPNPAGQNQVITISTNIQGKIAYKITDVAGRVIRTDVFTSSTKVAGLLPGTYIINAEDNNGVSTTSKKIIIQ